MQWGALNAALESPQLKEQNSAHLDALPATVVERLAARGLQGTDRFTFPEPGPLMPMSLSAAIPFLLRLPISFLKVPCTRRYHSALIRTCGVLGDEDVSTQTIRFSLCGSVSSCSSMVAKKSSCWSKKPAPSHSPAIRLAHPSGDEAFKLLRSPATENLAPVAQERIVRQAAYRYRGDASGNSPIPPTRRAAEDPAC